MRCERHAVTAVMHFAGPGRGLGVGRASRSPIPHAYYVEQRRRHARPPRRPARRVGAPPGLLLVARPCTGCRRRPPIRRRTTRPGRFNAVRRDQARRRAGRCPTTSARTASPRFDCATSTRRGRIRTALSARTTGPSTTPFPGRLTAARGGPRFEVFGSRLRDARRHVPARLRPRVGPRRRARPVARRARVRSSPRAPTTSATGRPHSVLDVLASVERVTGRSAGARDLGPRRPGDPPVLHASSERIPERAGLAPALRGISTRSWRRRGAGTAHTPAATPKTAPGVLRGRAVAHPLERLVRYGRPYRGQLGARRGWRWRCTGRRTAASSTCSGRC